MIYEKLKVIALQAIKLLAAIMITGIGILTVFYPLFIQMDYKSEGVWGYLFLIPVGITLIIVMMNVVDWNKLGTFPKWDEIEIKNNKTIRL